MTILYADDDADDREIFSLALKEISPNYMAVYAYDGRDAIEQLSQLVEKPAFIFLDINMPIMTGTECLVRLKADSRWSDIPVVIYTTTSDQKELRKHISLGAHDFVTKSYSLGDARKSISQVLTKDYSPIF